MKLQNAHSTPSESEIMYLILKEVRALKNEFSNLKSENYDLAEKVNKVYNVFNNDAPVVPEKKLTKKQRIKRNAEARFKEDLETIIRENRKGT